MFQRRSTSSAAAAITTTTTTTSAPLSGSSPSTSQTTTPSSSTTSRNLSSNGLSLRRNGSDSEIVHIVDINGSSNINGTSSPSSKSKSTTQFWRKRLKSAGGRKRRGTHDNNNITVLFVGTSCIGLFLIVLWIIFAFQFTLFSSFAAYTYDTTIPKFELYSKQAPQCHPLRSANDITITLVTQLSHDRLWMMEYHCQRYIQGKYPMSIAVYTNNTLDEIKQQLREMNCPVDEHYENKEIPMQYHEFIEEEENKNNQKHEEEQHERDDDENIEEDDDHLGRQQRKQPLYQPQTPQRRQLLQQQEQSNLYTFPHYKGPILQVSVLDAQTHGSWNDYPVNELRNLALSQVQTTYIIYIDVDFWTSSNMYETIIESTEIQHVLLEDPKHALVIPAFALFRQCGEWKDCRTKNIPKMPYTLDELANMIQKKRGHIFDPTNKGGHGSTNYKQWIKQKPGSLHNIDCLQSHRYEPFVMIRYCYDLPPFQSIFSGYGKNKVTWMMQLIASGYKLSQIGGVYLIHYPHLDSSSRQHWNLAPKQLQVPMKQQPSKSKKNDGTMAPQDYYNIRRPKSTDRNLHLSDYKRGQVDKLYVQFKHWLKESIPQDRVRLDLCPNAQDDDGRLWIDPESKKREEEK